MNYMLICICGLQGSGKTTLAKNLVKKIPNSIHLDVDMISHQVLTIKECKNEIVDNFGDVLTNNEIDRKKLGNIVFNSEAKMNILTKFTWKYMEKIIDEFIERNKNCTIILDWLLLTKTKYFKKSSIKILLDIPYEVRIKRVLLRENITKKRFNLRDNAAPSYNKEDFDYILSDNNSESIERIIKSI